VTRHIADHDRKTGRPSRAEYYLRIERLAGPHPSAKALHRRKSLTQTPGRLKAFTRIARGHHA